MKLSPNDLSSSESNIIFIEKLLQNVINNNNNKKQLSKKHIHLLCKSMAKSIDKTNFINLLQEQLINTFLQDLKKESGEPLIFSNSNTKAISNFVDSKLTQFLEQCKSILINSDVYIKLMKQILSNKSEIMTICIESLLSYQHNTHKIILNIICPNLFKKLEQLLNPQWSINNTEHHIKHFFIDSSCNYVIHRLINSITLLLRIVIPLVDLCYNNNITFAHWILVLYSLNIIYYTQNVNYNNEIINPLYSLEQCFIENKQIIMKVMQILYESINYEVQYKSNYHFNQGIKEMKSLYIQLMSCFRDSYGQDLNYNLMNKTASEHIALMGEKLFKMVQNFIEQRYLFINNFEFVDIILFAPKKCNLFNNIINLDKKTNDFKFKKINNNKPTEYNDHFQIKILEALQKINNKRNTSYQTILHPNKSGLIITVRLIYVSLLIPNHNENMCPGITIQCPPTLMMSELMVHIQNNKSKQQSNKLFYKWLHDNNNHKINIKINETQYVKPNESLYTAVQIPGTACSWSIFKDNDIHYVSFVLKLFVDK